MFPLDMRLRPNMGNAIFLSSFIHSCAHFCSSFPLLTTFPGEIFRSPFPPPPTRQCPSQRCCTHLLLYGPLILILNPESTAKSYPPLLYHHPPPPSSIPTTVTTPPTTTKPPNNKQTKESALLARVTNKQTTVANHWYESRTSLVRLRALLKCPRNRLYPIVKSQPSKHPRARNDHTQLATQRDIISLRGMF